jgi:PilZ domain
VSSEAAKPHRRGAMTVSVKNRRYARVGLPKGMMVAWEHSGMRQVSRVSVLALGGLFISTPNPLPAGEVIKIVFEIPGGDVRARATVRDSQPNKGMGVEFTAMNQEARARLNQLMKMLTREIRPRTGP